MLVKTLLQLKVKSTIWVWVQFIVAEKDVCLARLSCLNRWVFLRKTWETMISRGWVRSVKTGFCCNFTYIRILQQFQCFPFLFYLILKTITRIVVKLWYQYISKTEIRQVVLTYSRNSLRMPQFFRRYLVVKGRWQEHNECWCDMPSDLAVEGTTLSIEWPLIGGSTVHKIVNFDNSFHLQKCPFRERIRADRVPAVCCIPDLANSVEPIKVIVEEHLLNPDSICALTQGVLTDT